MIFFATGLGALATYAVVRGQHRAQAPIVERATIFTPQTRSVTGGIFSNTGDLARIRLRAYLPIGWSGGRVRIVLSVETRSARARKSKIVFQRLIAAPIARQTDANAKSQA